MLTHQWSAGIRRNLEAAVTFADSSGSLQRGEGFLYWFPARLDASRHMLFMAWLTPALPEKVRARLTSSLAAGMDQSFK